MNACLPESPSGTGWVISEAKFEGPETKYAWSPDIVSDGGPPEGIRAGEMGV
ncbi:MAG: hypothetical protein OSB75_12785 [Dehalococcoidia bacterium]|nr:hypothetical protein [Dehalococcoidia bacterium]